MSLTSSLQRIVSAKESIRQAIESKGVTVASSVGIADYPSYIGAITGGASCVLLSKVITANGVYSAVDDNADGYSEVTVSVPAGGGGGAFDVDGWAYHTMSEINDPNGLIKAIGTAGSTAMGFYPSCSWQSMLTSVYMASCSWIGNYGFTSCSSLSYVNLPNCTDIMNYAFANCTALTDISIPNCTTIGGSAFLSCNLSATLDLPNCSTIGYSAFMNCSQIASVTIPNCSYIESSAFYGTSLTYLYAPNCSYIGQSFITVSTSPRTLYVSSHCRIAQYCGQATVQEGTYSKYIQYYPFNDNDHFCWCDMGGNSGTATLTLHEDCVTVTSPVTISGWTKTPSLASIDLSNVTYLPYGAFSSVYNKQYIKSVTGSHVIEIGSSCFYLSGYYGSFAYLSFEALEMLPSYFIYGNSAGVRVQQVTTSYLKYVGSYALKNLANISVLRLSPNCSYIGEQAFSNCNKIVINNNERLKMPNLSTIYASTFNRCWSITNMDLPNVGQIYGYAFQYCSNLGAFRVEKATLGAGNTFAYCSKLSKFEVLNSAIPNLATNDLTGTGLSVSTTLGYWGSIYVRASLLSSFKTATNWTTYSNRMVGMYSFSVGDATYWGAEGSTYTQWANDTFDNEDGLVINGTSLYTSDGTKYVVGMDLTSTIEDGATFTLADV